MTYVISLDAISDPTRRTLLERIRLSPSSVGELTKVVPVSQPAVSQHLRVLKEAGLVAVRKEGAKRIYSLAPEGVQELRDYLDSLWGDVLDAFKQSAEEHSKGEATYETDEKDGDKNDH